MTAEAVPHPERVASMEDWLVATRQLLGKIDETLHATMAQLDARLRVYDRCKDELFQKQVAEAEILMAGPRGERDPEDLFERHLLDARR